MELPIFFFAKMLLSNFPGFTGNQRGEKLIENHTSLVCKEVVSICILFIQCLLDDMVIHG